MEQKEKELLIKDLSARLLYKVKFSSNLLEEEKQEVVNAVFTLHSVNTDGYCEALEESGHIPLDFVKPYLRPLSSMTENERDEYYGRTMTIDIVKTSKQVIDWLNKNMFDYRGLIPMGLALEAKDGMYNS